jgi:hypothetical protein
MEIGTARLKYKHKNTKQSMVYELETEQYLVGVSWACQGERRR